MSGSGERKTTMMRWVNRETRVTTAKAALLVGLLSLVMSVPAGQRAFPDDAPAAVPLTPAPPTLEVQPVPAPTPARPRGVRAAGRATLKVSKEQSKEIEAELAGA